MSTTPVWRVVAERELRAQVMSKSFLVSLIITCVGIVASIVVASILSDRAPSYDIAVTGAQGKQIASSVTAQLPRDAEVDVRVYDDTVAAERAVKDDKADVALLQTEDGWELVGDEEIGAIGPALTSATNAAVVQANAEQQGVNLDRLNAGAQVTERLLDAQQEDRGGLSFAGFAMGLLFYLMALVFGLQIAQSVVQERESRVVEILAAAVPTRALLWGKIATNTLLAVAEAALVAGLALGTMWLTGMDGLASGVGPAIAWYLAYFLVGFVALASLWSAAGTLAGRTADINSTTLPMQMVLMGGYFFGAFADGRPQEIASMVPVISPMIMPARIALGEAPLWQILLGLALNAIAAFVLIRIGARIYDRHLLQTGRKISFKEALARG